MTESTTFEDLELLDGADLKAVFDQLPTEELAAALWGTPAGLRGRLLRNLGRRHSVVIEQAIAATDHVTFLQVRDAQDKLLAVMCDLSRTGQIAFDMPEDMVA